MGKNDALTRIINGAARTSQNSSDFDLNADYVPPKKVKLRSAAVLLPIIDHPDGLQLILTKRSNALHHHPGQIAFPGGKIDPSDSGPQAAALREAEEEIGLYRDNVKILAELPHHETITGFSIHPIIGQVISEFEPKPELGEVAEVFTVPLSFMVDPKNFAVESFTWRGLNRSFYSIPYGPYYIWGATARILRALAEGVHS